MKKELINTALLITAFYIGYKLIKFLLINT
jgi:hypothetical protein